MVLCHIYPKEISASQLADLAGYSTKSKYIFKSGALELLEKEALIELREILKTRNFTEEELFNEFYNICKKFEIKNTDFFKTAYVN